MERFNKIRRILGLLVFLILFAGCATTSEVKMIKEETRNAQYTSEQALKVARESNRIAEEANSRSLRNEEMINRSFKKSMKK